MSDDILVLAQTLRAETQAKAGHMDPPAVHDCWKELIERLKGLTAALGECQTDLRDTMLVLEAHRQTHERQNQRIEELEAAQESTDWQILVEEIREYAVLSDEHVAEFSRLAHQAVTAGESDPCADGHDFVSRGDGTATCSDCGELCDVSETGAARIRRRGTVEDSES